MKNQYLSFLFVSILFVFVSSCDKKDDPAPAPKTKTELLTQGSWKFQSANSSLLGDISTNPLLACYVDNVMTFASNLTGTIDEGALSCTTPAPATFTWAFQSDETILHLSFTLFTGGSPDFTIVSLTETNFVASQLVTFPGYPAQTITVTFKH